MLAHLILNLTRQLTERASLDRTWNSW